MDGFEATLEILDVNLRDGNDAHHRDDRHALQGDPDRCLAQS